VFDDANRYDHPSDPTYKPFLRSGEQFVGQRALKRQAIGETPTSDEVRVGAVKPSGSVYGYGQHEVLPTDTRRKIGSAKLASLRGLQSGARTSTQFTFFLQPDQKEVGAHTGALPNPSGRGSTNTRGQAPAHDTLRKKIDELIANKVTDSDEAANEMMLAQIGVQPTGRHVLESSYITGAHSGYGVLGPALTPNATPDPVRLRIAQESQDRREVMKERTRSLKRERNRGRSPSPPRTRIDSSGKGGEPVTVPSSSYPTVPIPSFFGSRSSHEYAANVGGWLTQPMRHDPTGTVPLIPTTIPTTPSVQTTVQTPVVQTPVVPTPVPQTPVVPTPVATAPPFTVGTAPPPAKKKRRKKRGW
jgi:hypothetical protein